MQVSYVTALTTSHPRDQVNPGLGLTFFTLCGSLYVRKVDGMGRGRLVHN